MPLPEQSSFSFTDLWNSSTFDVNLKNHEYFTAYLRINAKATLTNGKRREYEVARQRLASRLYTAFSELGYKIAEFRPAERPQFGNFTSHVVVSGWVPTEEGDTQPFRPSQHPLEARTVNSNGTRTGNGLRTGLGGNVQKRLALTTEFQTAVFNFKSTVNAMLLADFVNEGFPVSLYKLDYQGVTFGDGGIHFPTE